MPQTFADFAMVCIVLRWQLASHLFEQSWCTVPALLMPWFLTQLTGIGQKRHVTRPAGVRQWAELNALGLLMTCVLINLRFAMPFDQLMAIGGWIAGTALICELALNRASGLAMSARLRRHRLAWSRGGEVLATVLAIWVWDRLDQSERLPWPIYVWVACSSGAVVWFGRRWKSRWRWILAPAAALPVLLWFLQGTPLGQPIGRLILLSALAMAASAVHARCVGQCGSRSPQAIWLWFMTLAGLWLGEPLLNSQATGAGDAHWYTMVMADAIAQWRAGLFPPLIGQSQYAFNGSSFPGCFAPYYQLLGLTIYGLSGGTLSVYAVQHLTIIVSFLGGIFSVYGVLRALTRAPCAPCALLALLYAASPAWLGAIYSMDMYMTVMTLPWLPLVFFGFVLTFIRLDSRSALWVVVPLAMVWYAHPPVALWTTLGLGAGQLFRLSSRPNPWRREVAWMLQTGALFFLLICLPVATAHFAAPRVDAFRHNYVMETLSSHWMAAWLPVSDGADRLSDQQLGWSLAVVALAGGYLAVRKNQHAFSSIVAVVGGFILLLTPLPFVQGALWNAVPSAIKLVTNNWPSQRLYPILAAAITVGCGSAWLRAVRLRRLQAHSMNVALWLAVALSLSEASKFHRRAHQTTLTPEASARQIEAENLTLTRYAYEMFERKPDYVADGVMSPLLQNRLLETATLKELAANATAVRAHAGARFIELRTRANSAEEIELSPSVLLAPGREYLMEFSFAQQLYVGTLTLRGEHMDRRYHLPSDGGPQAFGSAPGQGKSLVLWTSGSTPETVHFAFHPSHDSAFVPSVFARVQMIEIHREQLPIQLTSLVPYRAQVHAAEPAWLETPRMFLSGYAATVDGHRTEVRRSPQGLVMIRVPAGQSQVTLFFVGPPMVRIALCIAFATWICLLAAAITRRPTARIPGQSWFPSATPQGRPISARSAVRG